MGVHNLWKALAKGNAVRTLEGSKGHAQIVKEVENKVVAVDLSAWLMQAQTQPALLEHYDSDYARAVKVVFDRTIHWLRYGVLPVFVIEGQTPAAKLDKLRQRCVAQYGPTRAYNVGNRSGGQFDRIGQAVKRLLDALGVPCVQATGEGEAMCAALNLCGWVHACHTLDVDVLLFGAITVYRQMNLQTTDPRNSVLSKCCRSDVQRVLGISRGGDAALMAVAQLAGGDYDTVGAEQVGESLALSAVRCLLRGCEDDETVLQKLEAALAAGPDPELDALTKCTGCKACGHEGGMKSRINQHTARHGGCTACGSDSSCVKRDWSECECAFHRRADERLLNRVVRRATATPGFISSCRTAAATYADQLQQAIASVQREFGLPTPGSSRNVFSWRARPDVASVSDIMCRYIKEWDHHQVRLKLLPLLLEWDVRQGPSPGPSAGVQFRPIGIRKVSGKGAEDNAGVPARQQQGWRYVLLVERLQVKQQQQQQLGSSSGGAAAAATAATDGVSEPDREDEDLAIDLAWIAGTARSKPPKAAADGAAGTGADGLLGGVAGGVDDDEGQPGSQAFLSQACTDTQGGYSYSQEGLSQGGLSQAGASQAAAGGGSSGGGRSGGGSLQFSEHRSVRCSLMEAVWPDVVAAYRNPPATSGRARSAGRKKKAAVGAAAAAPENQRSLKDFFGTVKDYTVPVKPSAEPGARQPAAADARDGGVIPGLAGIAGSCSGAAAAAAAAGAPTGMSPRGVVVAAAAAGNGPSSTAAPGVGGGFDVSHSSTKKQHEESFMDWLDGMTQAMPGQQKQQLSQQQQSQQSSQQPDMWGYDAAPGSPHGGPSASQAAASGAAAAAGTGGSQRVFVGVRHSSKAAASPSKPAAGGGRTPGAGGRGRGRGAGKHSGKGMQAGALERFLQPAAQHSSLHQQTSTQRNDQQQQQELSQHSDQHQQEPPPLQQPQQQQEVSGPGQTSPVVIDCCDSPEVMPLAARLASRRKADLQAAAAGTAAGLAGTAAPWAVAGRARDTAAAATEAALGPPAKKLCSPEKTAAAISHAASSSQQTHQQQQQQQQPSAAEPQPKFTAQYLALLDQVAGLSPMPTEQQPLAADAAAPGSAARELFRRQDSTQQLQQHIPAEDVIELLDSPGPASGSQAESDVVDLT